MLSFRERDLCNDLVAIFEEFIEDGETDEQILDLVRDLLSEIRAVFSGAKDG